jgi:hypothetical protein
LRATEASITTALAITLMLYQFADRIGQWRVRIADTKE